MAGMKAFRYKRLEVYRLAFQFKVLVYHVCRSLPKSRGGTRMNIERHLGDTALPIVRATCALTRGDAVWELRVARRAIHDCMRHMRPLRESGDGDQARITAALELGERAIVLLTQTMKRLKAGGSF